MVIKFFCDKADCEEEIDQSYGGGTFTFILKQTVLDPKTKQLLPHLEQKEFHLCVKHSNEIMEFIKNKNTK